MLSVKYMHTYTSLPRRFLPQKKTYLNDDLDADLDTDLDDGLK